MKVCVFGAGATGGNFAARLALAGNDVSVVARGAQLEAIRANGLELRSGPDVFHARPRASDDPTALGRQDIVIVGAKATGLGAVAAALAPLIGPETLVVFPQNGIPWWYPLRAVPGAPPPPDLPVFRLAAAFAPVLPPERTIGGVIYSSNEVIAPGVVAHRNPPLNRLEIGPAADSAPPLDDLRAALEAAGIQSPAPAEIRAVVWRKLLVNMSASALALATGQLSSAPKTDPALGETFLRIVREGLAAAAAHGFPMPEIEPEALLARLPEHKPSILQDYELGRPMEIAEIVLAPAAFARAAGIETPTLDAIGAVTAALARARSLYRG